ECGGTSSCVPVLPSMTRISLRYGLSGPIRRYGFIWNGGKVGQVQGYSGATSNERSTNRDFVFDPDSVCPKSDPSAAIQPKHTANEIVPAQAPPRQSVRTMIRFLSDRSFGTIELLAAGPFSR